MDELLSGYFSKAAEFEEGAWLCGSETILKAFEWGEDIAPDGPPFEVVGVYTRPLLVIPDSRGRIRIWRRLLKQPYWRAAVALCSASTPVDHRGCLDRQGVRSVVAGAERVDLRAALEELSRRFGVERVRVGSGGLLNGVLVRSRLVHEVSLMIVPVLVAGETRASFFRAPPPEGPDGLMDMTLLDIQHLVRDVGFDAACQLRASPDIRRALSPERGPTISLITTMTSTVL